jgi:hypothetical protein
VCAFIGARIFKIHMPINIYPYIHTMFTCTCVSRSGGDGLLTVLGDVVAAHINKKQSKAYVNGLTEVRMCVCVCVCERVCMTK